MILRLLSKAKSLLNGPLQLQQDLILINQGRTLTRLNAALPPSASLCEAEFKIFSQFGEDGILQHLIGKIPSITKCFVEFGVETFVESNCRFLMAKDGWRGVVFDGSQENVARIKSAPWFWRSRLEAHAAFIDRDNVADLFRLAGVPREPGILSIDIDGVDYHVLEALADYWPAILVCEYNALFGMRRAVSVPYDPEFQRFRAHHSGSYFGASLASFTHLADQRGYALVGTTSEGLNAFFVRRDLLWPGAPDLTPDEAWRPLGFRQARNAAGQLTHVGMMDEVSQIADLPLIDVLTNKSLVVRDLPNWPEMDA